jgi:hypothetical protein
MCDSKNTLPATVREEGAAFAPYSRRTPVDTLRKTPYPQAWIATIADKLEVTLEGYTAPQGGVGFGGKGGSSAKAVA